MKSVNPILDGVKAVVDYYLERGTAGELTEAMRLDGKRCLITGASAGLGRALAVELARRGAHTVLAIRGGHEGMAEEIRRESGNPGVTQVPLDLADLSTVEALAERLAAEGARFDVVVSNAGVAPAKNRTTRDGFAEILQVNFLGSFLLVHRLLERGVLPNRTLVGSGPGASTPRLLITSSESHRQAPPIEFDRFGYFPDFGLLDGTTWYGHSKLYVQTWACELGRRLAPSGSVDVSVFSYCPGAVRSRISREAGLAGRIMTSYFIDPKKAIWPAVYSAVSPALEGRSERYFYLKHEAQPAQVASDPRHGALLWQCSVEQLAGAGHPLPAWPGR